MYSKNQILKSNTENEYIKYLNLEYNKSMKNFNPQKQKKSVEKSVISIRLDSELLEKVDMASAKADISRNEFLVQCIEYALNNLK